MLKQIHCADKERHLFAQSRLANMGVGVGISQTLPWLCNNRVNSTQCMLLLLTYA